MPRLNPGVQGSPIVDVVDTLDRLTDGAGGSPVFVGPAIVPTRLTPGSPGSPIQRIGDTGPTWDELPGTWDSLPGTFDNPLGV